MNVVVAGGGHMGSHLLAQLLAEGHEVVAIDVDARVTERLYSQQGVVAVTGSATDMAVLEQAGIKRADVAVAMTGRDADNLAFCLLARYFGVPRVLARMLDPQYEVPYRLVGATKIHSEAGILVGSFLTSIEYPEISSLMPIGRADLVAFEVRVGVDSVVSGQSIADIVRGPDFPRRCVFIGVESATGEVELPTGATRLRGGETLILAAHRPDLPQILRCLTGRREGALPAERSELVEVLAQVSFLSGLSREDLAELAAGARLEKRPRGETLFRAGDAGDRLFILRRGVVELEHRGGRKGALRPPSHFGERAAITGEPRTQTARVIEDAELLALDSSAFRAVLLKNPFLALELGKGFFTQPPREEP